MREKRGRGSFRTGGGEDASGASSDFLIDSFVLSIGSCSFVGI